MTVLAMALDSTPPPAPEVPRRPRVPARTTGRRSSLAQRIELILANAAEPVPERPRTRADCADVPRPCPFVSCRHSLYLDVNRSGGVKLNFPSLEPGDMPPEWSCALDVADRGGATLERTAAALNITREGIRLIEVAALDALGRTHLRVLKEHL